MRVTDLVKKHGLNIRVYCEGTLSHTPFTVLRKGEPVNGKNTFECQQDDGRSFILHELFDDYVLAPQDNA